MIIGRSANRLSEYLPRIRRDIEAVHFEEPVAADDYDGHRKLAAATTIPIATGENEYTRYGFRDLIKHDAAAILNADAKILGGVTEFMKVAARSPRNWHRSQLRSVGSISRPLS